MKLYCQAGQHHWERPAQRGRPPLNCPEHSKKSKANKAVLRASINPSDRLDSTAGRLIEDPSRISGDLRASENARVRMAQLRERKAEKARERALRAREAKELERASLLGELPSLNDSYGSALDAALRTNRHDDWRRVENLQGRIISIGRVIA